MTTADREYLRAHVAAMRGTRIADLTLWLLAECDSLTADLGRALSVCEYMADLMRGLRPELPNHPCA